MTKSHKYDVQGIELFQKYKHFWEPYEWDWSDFNWVDRPEDPNVLLNKYALKFRKRHGLKI